MLEDPKTKVAYDTDGVQTVFAIDMPFDHEDEIHAWIRDKTTKLQDLFVNPDDFFIEDKNLITTAVWAKGYRLVIKRGVTIRQLLQILYGGPLPSEAIEEGSRLPYKDSPAARGKALPGAISARKYRYRKPRAQGSRGGLLPEVSFRCYYLGAGLQR